MYSEFLRKAQVVIAPHPPLQQLAADLQHSNNERTRMLAEVGDLRQRVELQERRLKEVEGEKVALDAQLSSATGQLRHAREKATENIRRCVCWGGVHVYTYMHVCKVYSSQTDVNQCTYVGTSSIYVCTYVGTSSIYVCTYVGTSSIYVCTYVGTSSIYVCTYVGTSSIYVCTYVHAHLLSFSCCCACMSVSPLLRM